MLLGRKCHTMIFIFDISLFVSFPFFSHLKSNKSWGGVGNMLPVRLDTTLYCYLNFSYCARFQCSLYMYYVNNVGKLSRA